MQVERTPRKLWYRWTEGGQETEYGSNIPTPVPEIKCDPIVTTRETYPQRFIAYGLYNNGLTSIWGQGWTFTAVQFHATYHSVYQGQTYYSVYISWQNPLGVTRTYAESGAVGYSWYANYFDFSVITETRNNLLVGGARIQNPTLNTPCPTWRFSGGNCPEGSLDCGSCCLDCAAIASAIRGVTNTVISHSKRR